MNVAVNMDRNRPLLLRGREVAASLGISRAQAYKWMKNGTLPTVRISRAVRVPHGALMAWIDENTSPADRASCALMLRLETQR
jgi:excisionase family DNA binding protein